MCEANLGYDNVTTGKGRISIEKYKMMMDRWVVMRIMSMHNRQADGNEVESQMMKSEERD